MREPSQRADELVHQFIGAAIEVHRILGPGYLESVYEEALAIEFELQGIPFLRQKQLIVEHKTKIAGEYGLISWLAANSSSNSRRLIEYIPFILRL